MIYQPIEYTGEYTIGTIYSEEYVKKLEQQLQQKENIIKEARKKLINSKEYKAVKSLDFNSKMSVLIELEEILDKENI